MELGAVCGKAGSSKRRLGLQAVAYDLKKIAALS
jgi:hypothetical protein